MSTATDPAPATHDVELAITGMTCASCANRIERKLNKLDGVTATVNYATEKAKVTFPDTVSPEVLLETVEQAGYAASLPVAPGAEAGEVVADDPARPWRDRLIVSTLLSVPVIVLAMVSAWQFEYWQWLSFTLAAPVVDGSARSTLMDAQESFYFSSDAWGCRVGVPRPIR